LRNPETNEAVALQITNQHGKDTVVKLPQQMGNVRTLTDERGVPTGYYAWGNKTLHQSDLLAFLAAQGAGSYAGTNAPAASATNAAPKRLVLKDGKLVPVQ
jgi:hypothetical protein